MAWNACNQMLESNAPNETLVAMLSSCTPPPLRGGACILPAGMEEGGSTKRPFYSIFDSLDDTAGDGEVADDSTSHVEKKRRLTVEQVRSLEMSFEVENRLEPVRKMQLAQELGLQPRQVAVWFQNRRARWKTKQLERDYDILKAAYDAVVEDNKRLKAELDQLANSKQNGDVKREVLDESEVPVLQQSGDVKILASLKNSEELGISRPDSPNDASSKSKEESPISDGYNSEVADAFSPRATNKAKLKQLQGSNTSEAVGLQLVKEETYGEEAFPQIYRQHNNNNNSNSNSNNKLDDDETGLTILDNELENCFFPSVSEEQNGTWAWWDCWSAGNI